MQEGMGLSCKKKVNIPGWQIHFNGKEKGAVDQV